MDNCIARQPIIGKDGKIAAYELLYFQNSQTVDSPHDFHTAQAIVQFFNQLDESSFLDGRDAFLSFTPNLLMQNIPRVFDPHKLVIQVEDSVLVHLALPGSDAERAVREAAEEMAQRAVQRIRALAPVDETPEADVPAPAEVAATAPAAPVAAPAAAEPPLENMAEDVQAEADVLSDAELDRTLSEAATQSDDSVADVLPDAPAVADTAAEVAPVESGAEALPVEDEAAALIDEAQEAPAQEAAEAPEAASAPAAAEDEALPEPRSNASRAALEDELFPLEEPPATPSVSAPAAPAAPRPKPAPATSPEILTGGGFLPGA